MGISTRSLGAHRPSSPRSVRGLQAKYPWLLRCHTVRQVVIRRRTVVVQELGPGPGQRNWDRDRNNRNWDWDRNNRNWDRDRNNRNWDRDEFGHWFFVIGARFVGLVDRFDGHDWNVNPDADCYHWPQA